VHSLADFQAVFKALHKRFKLWHDVVIFMSELCRKAFCQLYPEVDVSVYEFDLTYSRAFKAYNANVRYIRGAKKYTFKLAYEWKGVDAEIVMGIIQHLMLKLFRFKASNKNNIELYESFIRNVHKTLPKDATDLVLRASFDRVNERYFYGTMDIANLRWGSATTRTLGHYQYGDDMITISTIFEDAPRHLLDYVMYHEMLHKKHKFKTTARGRSMHHSRAFRDDEKKYEGFSGVEKELDRFVRGKRGFFKRLF
jgi:hypothetical protein